jgi:argininosuccinate lyase
LVKSSAPKTWSQRFESALHPAIAVFNASIGFDIALLDYDLTGSEAHARMLAKTGIISPEEADTLVAGLQQIRAEYRQGQFNPGVEDEDVHFAVEHRLVALVGDVGKKLHTARSRNDQVGTDIRLYLRDQIDQHSRCPAPVPNRSWWIRPPDHVETLIPGYTHLQRAQPVSLAHHLLAYFEMAQRDWERLGDVAKRVNVSPLGCGALAGTTFPIDRAYTAELLGIRRHGIATAWMGSAIATLPLSSPAAASLILVHLSRLSKEIILWASEEFGFVTLTDSCATGIQHHAPKEKPRRARTGAGQGGASVRPFAGTAGDDEGVTPGLQQGFAGRQGTAV